MSDIVERLRRKAIMCDYCRGDTELLNEAADEIERLRAELESERAKHKWISVKDRLPEKNAGKVLVVCVFPRCTIVDTRTYWKDGTWLWCNDCDITYWIPLPEPPKGEEE